MDCDKLQHRLRKSLLPRATRRAVSRSWDSDRGEEDFREASSRRRDCHSAAPASPFSRRFNRDDEGGANKNDSPADGCCEANALEVHPADARHDLRQHPVRRARVVLPERPGLPVHAPPARATVPHRWQCAPLRAHHCPIAGSARHGVRPPLHAAAIEYTRPEPAAARRYGRHRSPRMRLTSRTRRCGQRRCPSPSRRRDCHFADVPSTISIETPTKGRGGCSRMTVSPTATITSGSRTSVCGSGKPA